MKLLFSTLLLTVGLSLTLHDAWAQSSNTPTVERYAIVTITQKNLTTNKLKINLEYTAAGAPTQAINGAIIDDNGVAPPFSSKVEVLSYMGSKGWRLVSVIQIAETAPYTYQFFFARND